MIDMNPSLHHAMDLWRERALKAEALRDELLAALKFTEEALDAWGERRPNVTKALVQSRAAIAKAEELK